MERKLYEASLQGNVTSLVELLEEDPLILDRSVVVTGFYETPLHIAAMRGYVDFAKKILSTKPDLTSELDSHGFCPLHWAASKKSLDMVKVLLVANPDVCIDTDQDGGRTPLHLAAMKNRVEIMKVLIQTQPQAIRVLMDRRETILHLCVKHNRLEALKLLVEHLAAGTVPTDQEEPVVSVNSKDDDGNTILHLAVARRQMKMIKYLLDSNIGAELNGLNNKGFTALDILTQSSSSSRHEIRDIKDMEIGDLLRDAGVVVRAYSRKQLADQSAAGTHHEQQPQPPRGDQNSSSSSSSSKELKQKHNAFMVVASLIAAMAFQAGVNPPGGTWQGNGDDNKDTTGALLRVSVHDNINIHDGNGSPTPTPSFSRPLQLPKIKIFGTSVMAYNNLLRYNLYMSCNTIGFMASLVVIFLLISGLFLKRRFFVVLLRCALWVSVTFMALTYMFAVVSLSLVPNQFDFSSSVIYTLLAWFGLLGMAMFVHIIRFILILKKKCPVTN